MQVRIILIANKLGGIKTALTYTATKCDKINQPINIIIVRICTTEVGKMNIAGHPYL